METQNAIISPVIGFLDVDPFECQLWQRDFPEFRHRPCVVETKSGRIVAVSKEAKELGISRTSTEFTNRVLEVCPNIKIFTKPNAWGKPDSRKTRKATWEVLDCIREYCASFGDHIIIELASSDEFYIDLSTEIYRRMEAKLNWNQPENIPSNIFQENSAVSRQGPFKYHLKSVNFKYTLFSRYLHEDEDHLMLGALFMSDLSNFLLTKTSLTVSAGVGNNKLLAKIGCSLHKPEKVTLLHISAFNQMMFSVAIKEIPGLGGQLGQYLMNAFNITRVSELRSIISKGFKMEGLLHTETAKKIYDWVRGINHDPVVQKFMHTKFVCNKPRGDITRRCHLWKALEDLCGEVLYRIQEDKDRHQRFPMEVRFGFTLVNQDGKTKGENTFVDFSRRTSYTQLMQNVVNCIVNEPHFDRNCFRIRRLRFVVIFNELTPIQP